MNFGEALRFSLQALSANKVRTFLTALGLVIGNASVILVVTISLTSRDYILEQIRGIGSNIIWAYYDAGNRNSAAVDADFIKTADLEAVRTELGSRVIAATGVMKDFDRILVNGREREVALIGSDEHYAAVRNLVVLSGRTLDAADVSKRQRVAMLTEKLAQLLYGSQAGSVGQVIKLHGLQFTVIGSFREKTESFGLSELSKESILIPITVLRYFSPVEHIDPLYIQVRRPEEVVPVTKLVREIITRRHRPGAAYLVENLAGILEAANNIAMILTMVLILVSAIALLISGIGIMNIMLVTVTERTHEIGIRMAVGASRHDILSQFLAEAIIISVSGGLAGILIGVAIPVSIGYLTDIKIPVATESILVAFAVSFLVGLVFGILPANRASRLHPTEALRYQ
jgi:putative ABC transport system permease protein